MTTRRYPRTLREAFPGDDPWSIQGPFRRGERLLADVAGVLVTLATVGLVVWTLIDWAAAP